MMLHDDADVMMTICDSQNTAVETFFIFTAILVYIIYTLIYLNTTRLLQLWSAAYYHISKHRKDDAKLLTFHPCSPLEIRKMSPQSHRRRGTILYDL